IDQDSQTGIMQSYISLKTSRITINNKTESTQFPSSFTLLNMKIHSY
ncbi:1619_t:CDS:1, partial [Scutellospora calospora]